MWNALAGRTAARALLVVATLASAAPLFATRHLPFTDLPEHVAVISTLQHWHTPAFRVPEYYEIALSRSQYLLFHMVGAALASLLGDPERATRWMIVAAALALPWTFASLLRALGRDERLALFAPFVFWNRALTVGFLPFVVSIPIVLGALASAVRQARDPRPGRAVWLGALAVVLFYLHLSTYLLFLAIAAVVTWLAGRYPPSGRRISRVARRLAWAAPSLAFASAWMTHARLAVEGSSIAAPGEVGVMAVGTALHALPLWISYLFVSHVDEACSAVWWIAYVAVVVTGAGFSRRRCFTLTAAPLAISLAVYFLTPFQVGAGAMLNVRLAPLVALFALLPLRPRRTRAGRAALVAAALATVAMAVNTTLELRAVASEELGDVDALLAPTKPGARLLTLAFDARSTHMLFPPWLHMGAYHRIAKGGVSSFSFTELPHWPLRYRADHAPPKKARAFWEFYPCTFRNAIDGSYYDFVLVHGDVDPFRDEPPGPVFRPVSRTRAFTLYAKAPGETWAAWGKPDRGPCHGRDGSELDDGSRGSSGDDDDDDE